MAIALTLFALVLPAASSPAARSPVFNLRDAAGAPYDLGQWRGRWVVINYWASWCPPCLAEIPELASFQQRHGAGRAVVLGVNVERFDTESLRRIAGRLGINYPLLTADPRRPGPDGALPALPTTYILDPDGRLHHRQLGPLTAAQLERWLGLANNQASPAALPAGAT